MVILQCSKLCLRSCNSRGVVIMYTNAYNVAQSCILQHFLTLWGLTGPPNVTAAVSMLVAVYVTVAVALHRNPPALAHVTASCITCINTGPCVQIKVACTHSTMQYFDNKNIWFSIIFHWTINKISIYNYIEHSFQLKLQLAGITVGITKAMQRHFQYVIPLKGFYSLHPHIPSGSGKGGSCISEQLKESYQIDHLQHSYIHIF